jgi:hypothetical protein
MFSLLKASEALIAWNSGDTPTREEPTGEAPAGAVAVGPLSGSDESGWPDWAEPYVHIGRIAFVGRNCRFMLLQDERDLSDWDKTIDLTWQEVADANGLHLYIVHRAFLEIDEYFALTKEFGMGTDPDEPGHDRIWPYGPTWPYGPAMRSTRPLVRVFRTGHALHVWPVDNVAEKAA